MTIKFPEDKQREIDRIMSGIKTDINIEGVVKIDVTITNDVFIQLSPSAQKRIVEWALQRASMS